MSSSRSIAAARNRRSGDPAPKMQSQPQSRPITSISSQSAFAQNAGNNIKVTGKQSGSQQQQKNPNGLPFSKLTISDAIGLVTLRLGRVEQFMIDSQENEGGINSSGIPENSKLVDNSVLTSMINRLDSLEKKESGKLNNDKILKLERLIENLNFLLKTLSNKFDLFEENTNNKFIDYENAIVELEKSLLFEPPDFETSEFEPPEFKTSEFEEHKVETSEFEKSKFEVYEVEEDEVEEDEVEATDNDFMNDDKSVSAEL
jgi:hypothetical protein